MYACIFIPDFPVQAIIRFEQELRARPVAVLTGRPPLEKVVALNERARQTGVEVGTTKSQLEAWDDLVLRARSRRRRRRTRRCWIARNRFLRKWKTRRPAPCF